MNDKTLHKIFGALITLASGLLLYKFIDTNLLVYPMVGLIIGNIFGISKEFIWDKWMKKGTFSYPDMLATFWGTLVGGVLTIMITGTIEGLGK